MRASGRPAAAGRRRVDLGARRRPARRRLRRAHDAARGLRRAACWPAKPRGKARRRRSRRWRSPSGPTRSPTPEGTGPTASTCAIRRTARCCARPWPSTDAADVGHRRPDPDRPGRSAGRDLLQRVVRRPDRDAVGGLAGRGRSRVPPVARRRGVRRRAGVERGALGRGAVAPAARRRVSRPRAARPADRRPHGVRTCRARADRRVRARRDVRPGPPDGRRPDAAEKRGVRGQAAGRRVPFRRAAATATASACA